MMAALGQCGALSASTYVVVDEVTTVASLAALHLYMASATNLGSGSADATSFASAFAAVNEYANTATGTAPGPSLPSGYYASSKEISTLGNIVASCINSTGGAAGDGSACGNLFSLAAPTVGSAPANIIGAILDILSNPTHNAAAIFNLIGAIAPFQPTLSSAPTNWALPILPIPATPTFAPVADTYALGGTVTLSDTTADSTMYYTTDGTTPTASSTKYTGPYKPEADVTMARYVLNEQFVRGVNLAELMYFPSSNAGGRPPTTLMQQPELPALMHYIGRLSYLMSMGRPTASVALYLPSSSLWLNDRAADTQFVSAERLLSEHQINFDIVSEDALATDLTLGNGTFETMSGNLYRTVILPSVPLLSQAVLERLRSFAASGGHVLFLGRTPSLIAGKTILNARTPEPGEFSWASVAPGELSPTPTPSDDPPAQPPAAQGDSVIDAPDHSFRDP